MTRRVAAAISLLAGIVLLGTASNAQVSRRLFEARRSAETGEKPKPSWVDLTFSISISLTLFNQIMPVDGPCCAHDHDCEAEDCGPAWSLHKHIATARLRALNAAAPADASKLFRPWGERATPASPPLVSDDDDPPELLVHVPFDGLVKITAFSVVSCGSGEAGGRGETTAPPTRVRLFVNRDDLDFDSLASAEPTQEFEVAGGGAAEASRVEYPCRPSKFSGVYSVDVHFPGNSGGSGGGGGGSSRCNTRIDFLGFKGTHTQGKREAVVAVYESRAMPSDHKAAEEGIGGAADVS